MKNICLGKYLWFHLIFLFWSFCWENVLLLLYRINFRCIIPCSLPTQFYSGAIMESNSIINTEVSQCVSSPLCSCRAWRLLSINVVWLWLFWTLCKTICTSIDLSVVRLWRPHLSSCLAWTLQKGGQYDEDMAVSCVFLSPGVHSTSCRAL